MREKIINICRDLLRNFPAAEMTREYLDSRLPRDIQDEFKMGYFPSSNNLYLISDIIGENKLIKSGFFYYRIQDGESALACKMENHNLIMPYNNTYGEPIALVGRTVLSEDRYKELKISKYKNTSFIKGNYLFGLDKAKLEISKENKVFVVEGQFDCIQAMRYGIKNCVCLGCSNMTFNQFAILNRYTDNIILLLDNDSAGINGAEKIKKNYGEKANIIIGRIPDGYKDIDQFLLSEEDKAREFINSL